MNIVLFTDKAAPTHSAIEGLFGHDLYGRSEVVLVYFSKNITNATVDGRRIYLPYRCRKNDLIGTLSAVVDLTEFDVLIVRNLYSVLRQVLSISQRQDYKIGFWKSWPHTYRRLFTSLRDKKHTIRSRIEYFIKRKINIHYINKCDFFLPITNRMKESLFKGVSVPCFDLGMGISKELSLKKLDTNSNNKRLKYIYIGTIDELRETHVVIEAFHAVASDYELDIYTSSSGEEVDKIMEIIDRDKRISLYPPFDNADLQSVLERYDIGVNFTPDNVIFNTSSPTKIYEYYGVGLVALMNSNPEFELRLDEDEAFFCRFDVVSIKSCIEKISRFKRNRLIEMGRKGRENLSESEYSVMSEGVYSFLRGLDG